MINNYIVINVLKKPAFKDWAYTFSIIVLKHVYNELYILYIQYSYIVYIFILYIYI